MSDNKRKIKKRVLAEALRLYRDHQFPVKRFRMTVGIPGQVLSVEHREPYGHLDELLHQCARLEGHRP